MFAQTGVYFQDDQESSKFPSGISDEYEIRLFIVLFKGNEPHSGFAPILHPSQEPLSVNREELASVAPRLNVIDRVGFVSYLSRKAIERYLSKTAVFPPSSFYGSTSEEANARHDPAGTYTATHGLVISPTYADHVHWHMREACYMFQARIAWAGIRVDTDYLNGLPNHASVNLSGGNWVRASHMGVNDLNLHVEGPGAPCTQLESTTEVPATVTGESSLAENRRYIQWNSDFCERSNLHVQRRTIKADRTGKSKPKILPSGGEICGALQRAQLDFDPSKTTPPTLFSKVISVTWDSAKCEVCSIHPHS
jgi:hypothetical protein